MQLSNLVDYVATREGVEKVSDSSQRKQEYLSAEFTVLFYPPSGIQGEGLFHGYAESIAKRDAALKVEAKGEIPGSIVRDTIPSAADGVKWMLRDSIKSSHP